MNARVLLALVSITMLAACAADSQPSGLDSDTVVSVQEGDVTDIGWNEWDVDTATAPCPNVRIKPVPLTLGGDWRPFVPVQLMFVSPTPVTAFSWAVTSPDGSLPKADDSSPFLSFLPTGPGTHTVSLELTDTSGLLCATLSIPVEVHPARIQVVLAFETPGFVGPSSPWDTMRPDLDLHLLSSNGDGWFDPRWDCHYDNPAPDWGGAGRADDPELFEPWYLVKDLETITIAVFDTDS